MQSGSRVNPSPRARWFPWLAVLLVPLLSWPALRLPLERDEGEYAWAAQLLERGGVLYRDTFLQKPPGIVYVYRMIGALVGPSTLALHVVNLLVLTGTAALLGWIALRLTRSRVAATAGIAVFACSLSTPLYQANAANCEPFMVLATVAAFATLLLYSEWPTLARALGVGALLGLAGTMKQVAAAHALWLLPAVAAFAPSGRRVRDVAATTAAALAVLTICFLPTAAAGALPQLLDGVLLHNVEYISGRFEATYARMLWPPVFFLYLLHWAVLAGAGGGVVHLVRRRHYGTLLLLGGWAATAWIGAHAGPIERGHYLQQELPPLVLLAGLALAAMPRPVTAALAVVGAMLWLLAGGFQWQYGARAMLFQRYRSAGFLDAVAAGAWLRAQPQRSLYVFGSEPELYVYADATPVTRYVIQDPLFGGYRSSRARQEEAWSAITAALPAHVVTARPSFTIPLWPPSDHWMVARMDSLLRTRYRPVYSVGTLSRSPTPQSAADTAGRKFTVWERIP